jgi:hypothetical protein
MSAPNDKACVLIHTKCLLLEYYSTNICMTTFLDVCFRLSCLVQMLNFGCLRCSITRSRESVFLVVLFYEAVDYQLGKCLPFLARCSVLLVHLGLVCSGISMPASGYLYGLAYSNPISRFVQSGGEKQKGTLLLIY